MKNLVSAGGRANWKGAAFELRLGVKFCVDILLGDAAGLDAGAPHLVQLQAPDPVDDLVIEFENGSRWAIQAKAGRSVRVGWNPNHPFGKALRQLYEGATSGQIDLSPDSSDRIELAVDHQAHDSVTAFSEWVDKARHHHSWQSFAAASTGVEQKWANRLPSFLKVAPGDNLLAFLKKLFIRRAPAPDEWRSNLRGRLIGSGISRIETADQILDILLAQVATVAQYAGQLNKADLLRACQMDANTVSQSDSATLTVQASTVPSNMQQALAPIVPYAIRLSIITLILLPPLVFLALKWYFLPPTTVIEGLAWIVPTIGIWAAFLANPTQIIGFSLRDIWNKTNLQARWIKAIAATDLILGGVLLAVVVLTIARWQNPAEQPSQSIQSDKIVILVAEFSEGASYEVPPDRTITHKILMQLKELETRDPKIDVVEYGEVILDHDIAMQRGREYGATAVIWGTYTPSPTNVLVEPHLKLVSPSVTVFAEGHLTEPEERSVDIEAFHSFTLTLELKQEVAYLSSFVAGLAHYGEKRYDEALSEFDTALEFATDSESLRVESVYYYQGLILRQQGDYAKAEKQFEKAIAINPKFADAYNGLGLTYQAQGRIDEGVDQYLKAIDANPEFASAYNNLAVAYGIQDKPVEDRIDLYLKALEINPDSFITHQNLGLLYEDLGQHDKALAEYLDAVLANIYVADSWYYLASLYHDLARWEEAKTACQKALELAPDHAASHNLLGILYSYAGNSSQAIAEYKTALEINPNYASAHANLGLQYEYKGKQKQAQKEYEAALILEPSDPSYHCRLGSLYIEMGQTEKGESKIAECEKLVAISADDPGGHNDLGLTYLGLGEYQQAIQEFQQAIQLDSENHVYHSNLSSAYEELGQIEEAIEEAEIALHLAPESSDRHWRLFGLRWKASDYVGAIRELVSAMQTSPLSVKRNFVLILAVVLGGFVSTGYLLYVLKDEQRSEKALCVVLNWAIPVLTITIQGLETVDMHLQKTKDGPVRSSVTHLLSKASHFLAVIHYSLANIKLFSGQEEQALNSLQKALEVDSTYVPAAHKLVNLYIARDDLTTAYRFAQQTLKNKPHDAAMHIKLGDIFWVWNMIEEAIREWEEAVKANAQIVVNYRLDNLRIDPCNTPAHFTLGLAFEAKGEVDKSLTGFRATTSSTHNRILKHIAEQKIRMLQAIETDS